MRIKHLIKKGALIILMLFCASFAGWSQNAEYLFFDRLKFGIIEDNKIALLGPDENFSGGVIELQDTYLNPANNVTYTLVMIVDRAFENCTSLTGLNISKTAHLQTIWDEAFYGCTNLTGSINIPYHMRTIGSNAFYGTGITTVNCYAPNPPTLGDNVFPSDAGIETVNFMTYKNNDSWNAYTLEANSFSICPTEYDIFYIYNYLDIIDNTVELYRVSLVNRGYHILHQEPLRFYWENITVPETVTENNTAYSVVSIADGLFGTESGVGGADFFENITIGKNVTRIGNAAFKGLRSRDANDNVSDMILTFQSGSKLEYIGDEAFAGCADIKVLDLPTGVKHIGSQAFKDCTGLVGSLVLSEAVEEIGDEAFSGCSNFSKVECWNPEPPVAGQNAFQGLTDKTLYVMDATPYTAGGNWGGFENIESLGITFDGQKIDNCKNRYRVTSQNTVEVYGFITSGEWPDYAHINIPDEVTHDGQTYLVTSIGENALNLNHLDNPRIGNITIGKNVRIIKRQAFIWTSYKNSYWHITFAPDSQLEEIGDEAFRDANSYDGSLILPKSLKKIGIRAFYVYGFNSSLNMSAIYCLAPTKPQVGTKAFEMHIGLTSDLLNVPLYVLDVEEYTIPSNWGSFQQILPYSFSDDYFDYTCTSNSTVAITGYRKTNPVIDFDQIIDEAVSLPLDNSPMNVTTIAAHAFENNTTLTEIINLPVTVVFIGEAAFKGCSNLTTVSVFSNLTGIGDSAFEDCTSLTSLTSFHPSLGIETIGAKAFKGCASLTSFNLPALTTIGDNAFENCTSLANVNMQEGLISIGAGAFKGCAALTRLNLPEGITAIAAETCSGCTSLTHIEFPSTLTSIGDRAFEDCRKIMHIFSHAIVAPTVGEDVFYDPSSLDWGNLIISTPVVTNYCPSEASTGWGDFFKLNFHQADYYLNGIKYSRLSDTEAMLSEYQDWKLSGSFTIPETITDGDNTMTITRISDHAFRICQDITTITLPETIHTIGSFAFNSCTSLTDINFDGNVSAIESMTFNFCENLSNATAQRFIKNATSIGTNAFNECRNITEITFNHSITSIGNQAFDNCPLTQVICNASTKPSAGNLSSNLTENAKVFIPECYGTWGGIPEAKLVKVANFELCEGNPSIHYQGDWLQDAPQANDYIYILDDYTTTGSGRINAALLSVNSGVVLNNNHIIAGSTFIEDGAQMIYNVSELLENVTIRKSINAFTPGAKDGYYAITCPFLSGYTNNLTEGESDYDLFYYYEPTHYWMNYKQESTGFFHSCRGLLYASAADRMIQFTGSLVTSYSTTEMLCQEMSYTENLDVLRGFNLIGNNNTCDAVVADGRPFYVMNETGTGFVLGNVVKACEAVLIQATADDNGKFLQFEAPNSTRASQAKIELAVGNEEQSLIDNVRVSFGSNARMNKFYLNEGLTKLYIPQNDEEFAVVSAESVSTGSTSISEMPVNFKAEKDGKYTISVNVENLDVDYLHLIDNLTGADTDMMAAASTGSASYTFDAKTNDYTSRFKLVFSVNGNEDEGSTSSASDFAFISNGNLVIDNIEGQATLQIVDELGRVVSSEVVSGSYNKALNLKAGMYIINLDGMTQKIVVE
ncbi:MAG: leucine-rich repeat domain-containing protein [Bacteroidales bacterium]|nr:leucine-rich repeat domain-containing protein [Bacteroidales bacterium]